MVFIDLLADELPGRAIIDDFLASLPTNPEGGWRPEVVRYEALGAMRPRMFKLLGDRQHYRCCYCMRRIHDHNRTLEHIIPRSHGSHDCFDSYQLLGYAPLDRSRICAHYPDEPNPLIPVWDGRAVPPYPHNVAYGNLVVSCDGKMHESRPECCNPTRGDSWIEPLYLNADVDRFIEYRPDGEAIATAIMPNESTEQFERRERNTRALWSPLTVWKIRHHRHGAVPPRHIQQGRGPCVNLNCRALKDVRRAWFILSFANKPTSADGISVRARENYLTLAWASAHSQKQATPDDLIFLLKTYARNPISSAVGIDNRFLPWNILLDYDWFYDYYRRRRGE